MEIFIPTYGRADRQSTYTHLPKSLQKRVTLVVQYRERDLYAKFPNVDVLPPRITTIAPTRQYIASEVMGRSGKFVMLDDDLRFDWRRKDDKGKFLVATEKQVTQLFNKIEKSLDTYAHVGVLAREGGNREHSPEKQCTRMMRVLAYRADILWRENIKFDRLSTQEDFDVTLQLLRKGYKNNVLCQWVNGQGESGDAGGCSHFRTLELHNKNVQELARLHAPFVKIVEKATKGAWGGNTRLDVVVSWKKAFESSQK